MFKQGCIITAIYTHLILGIGSSEVRGVAQTTLCTTSIALLFLIQIYVTLSEYRAVSFLAIENIFYDKKGSRKLHYGKLRLACVVEYFLSFTYISSSTETG